MTPTRFPEPLERQTFDVARLMREHPPRLRDRNKRVVFEIACPPGCELGGTLSYSRWAAMPLPEAVNPGSRTVVESREDVYDYAPTPVSGPALEWHVNFADPLLFVAYGSGLLAQDEMQVAEHPALGSLREALLKTGHKALTAEDGKPTPVLVRGVERRVLIATDANVGEGRPQGLYGNRFAAAAPEVVARATRQIDPPTVSNLIAIAAPASGRGAYQHRDVELILTTAYTGFRAAVLETQDALGESAKTILHTGFWGCGAFGGDRTLMALLQLLAARLAGIDRVVFHTFDRQGSYAFADAQRTLARELDASTEPITLPGMIDRIVAMGFRWGVSDGN